MASKTLTMIMKYWIGEDFSALDPVKLPFNIEEFCRENDEALNEAFNKGMMHTSVPRDRVSIHGTDDCLNCDTGRITLYAGSRWCIECQHKADAAKAGAQ